jgi:hypothetical protein
VDALQGDKGYVAIGTTDGTIEALDEMVRVLSATLVGSDSVGHTPSHMHLPHVVTGVSRLYCVLLLLVFHSPFATRTQLLLMFTAAVGVLWTHGCAMHSPGNGCGRSAVFPVLCDT